MTLEDRALQDFHAIARQKLDEYLSHTNQVMGIMGFSTALGCAGLKLPATFAFIGLLFTLLVWADGMRISEPYLSSLRRAKDPSVKPLAMLRRSQVAIVGWLFLGAVALGLVPT